MRTFSLLAILTIVTASSVLADNPGGAKAAMAALPIQYSDGILKISADNGSPNPPKWYIVAKRDGAPYSIEISKGQIINERVSLDLRTLLSDSTINLNKVNIDSDGAWAAAEKYCANKGKKLGTVSYALQQKGRGSSPIWSIWCYDKRGRYIGLLQILATTGDIVSAE